MNDGTDILASRLRKHAVEIERLQVSAKGVELNAGILRRARKRMLLIMFAIIAALTIQSEFRIHGLKEDLRATQALLDEATRPWRSDDAPKLQRLTVVAEGFMDKKGEWRSFDDGSHLTVKQWKQ